MWLLVRLVAMVVGWLLRHALARRRPAPDGAIDGVPTWTHERRSKGRVAQASVGIAHPSDVVFTVHAERRFDRLFKAVGLAGELQTGDAGFDDDVFVACDHPAFAELLTHDPLARGALVEVVRSGGWVEGDGRVLWVRRDGPEPVGEADWSRLLHVAAALGPVARHFPDVPADPFVARALALEAVSWSLFGLAVAALGWPWTDFDPFYDGGRGDLWAPAGLLALLLACLLFGATVLLLGGSSRCHRVILECGLVLVLALPVVGLELAGDADRLLDPSPPVVLEAAVTDHRTWTTGRKSRTTHYAIEVEARALDVGLPLPEEIEVSRALHDALGEGTELRLTLHAGLFGEPWLAELTPLR